MVIHHVFLTQGLFQRSKLSVYFASILYYPGVHISHKLDILPGMMNLITLELSIPDNIILSTDNVSATSWTRKNSTWFLNPKQYL